MININNIVINSLGKIFLTSNAINNIEKYNEIAKKEQEESLRLEYENQKQIKKCKDFLNDVFLHFEENYYTELNSMLLICGFKCDKHYYQLINIDKYPIIDFCKIEYINNIPKKFIIFTINIEEDGSKNKIIEYLKSDLKDTIESNVKIHNIKTKYKEERNNQLKKLKQELSQFNNKPLYLLFREDNHTLDKSIRFKMIHDYPNDIIKIGKTILDNLKFIKSKGAKEYILMIPRKRIKESNSFSNPYYKVKNYKSNVKDDFTELGLNFLEYEDLRR